MRAALATARATDDSSRWVIRFSRVSPNVVIDITAASMAAPRP